ncbi:heterogeneous nuclear ribonucleoprotein 1-like [Tasmannia lanceolata]|uniref:heterogeneous nuclear ribonucleoprotein 1-like n=1 Tax=Tasmannia lanceolata TaxID=3420 RepID=UPI004062F946
METDQGKLFVGGISWETSEETLKDHFSKYGVVVDSVIMRDRNTGTARGFGFVLFSNPSDADNALLDKHLILGRMVEVKKALPRGDQHHQQQNRGSSKNTISNNSDNQFRTKKIFVGGLSSSLTEEEFKGYFEKFGRITDVVVMYDSSTHRPRGFGFITFDSEETVDKVMEKSFHELNDKQVEVKRAVPKDGNHSNNSSDNNNGYGMRMGGGRASVFGNYRGIYPAAYGPRHGVFHGYAPPPFSGYGNVGYPFGRGSYGGGYPMGAYGGVGYGAPMAVPRSPWNGLGIIGGRRSPAPYGNAAIYPGYVNGGVGGFVGGTGGSYHGVLGATNGKFNYSGVDAHRLAGSVYGGVPRTTPPRAESGKLDGDSSAFRSNYGAKQNQRGPDGQLRTYPDRAV